MGKLDGKVAVITGATRGIGKAIAAAYAEAGAAVVASSRSQKAVDETVHLFEEKGFKASGIAADVRLLPDLEAVRDHALQQFGKLDVWFNNAGLAGPYGPTWCMEVDTFEQVVQTNILGVYYGSLVAMRHFLAQGHGKLINMLGAGAKRPARFQNAYGSSKAWVRSFTLTLAQESRGSGVGVYAYSPGMVLTDLLTDVEVIEGYESRLDRFPAVLRMWANPPEKVTGEAVRLASAETDGQTGLEVYKLKPLQMMGGALRESLRSLTGGKPKPIDLKITCVPAAKDPAKKD